MMILLLVLLCCAAAAGVFIIIGTRRLGIPPMPSSPLVRDQVIQLLERHHRGRVIQELGSGWGGLARMIAREFPDQEVIGVEASLVPFFFSSMTVRLFGPSNLTFTRENFLETPLSPGRSYVCYLSTDIMAKLKASLSNRLLPGCIIVSMVFALPESSPLAEVEVNDLFRSRVFVYGESL